LVLTGVATLEDLLGAGGQHRPTYLAADLDGLLRGASAATLDRSAQESACGGWSCAVSNGLLEWAGQDEGETDGLDAFRAGVRLHWALTDAGQPPTGVQGEVPASCRAFQVRSR
jgi:glycerol 3-phosphatase-2